MTALFGERLREYRKLRAMSQAELAERLGVALNMISKLEHGVRKVTFEEAIQLAEVLDVSLYALAGLPPEETREGISRDNEHYTLFLELCERLTQSRGSNPAVASHLVQSSSPYNQRGLYQKHPTFSAYACSV